MATYDHNFLIISDLHLSEGFLTHEGKYAALEDFTSDEQFCEFLRYHQALRRQHDLPWKLIIAGDLFDFLQVTATPSKTPCCLEAKIQKFENALIKRIAQSNHPVSNPDRRRHQIMARLKEIKARLQKKRDTNNFVRLRCCGDKLQNLAQTISDDCLWHLEKLTLETYILSITNDGKLTKRHIKRGLGTSWPETMWKLDCIFEGHFSFFQTVASFLSQGNSLTIIKGNHDVELHWPEVQQRLTDLILDAQLSLPPALCTTTIKSSSIEFLPWIYFEPGLFYLEHGNQYELANAFDNFITPTLAANETLIQFPPGSFFVRYLLNKIEAQVPFADNLRPQTRFLAWMVKNNLLLSFKIIFGHMRHFVDFLGRLISRGIINYFQSRKLRQESNRLLPIVLNHSARNQLDCSLLQEIDETARKLRSGIVKKIIALMPFVLPALIVSALFVGPVVVFLTSIISRIGPPIIGTAVFTFAGLLLRRLLTPWIAKKLSGDNYLEAAAKEVWRILKANNIDVQYLIFGHNHDAEMSKLYPKQATSPWYVNSGTWLPYDMEEERWNQIEKTFSYLEIISNQPEATPGLYRWHSERRRPERIRLRYK